MNRKMKIMVAMFTLSMLYANTALATEVENPEFVNDFLNLAGAATKILTAVVGAVVILVSAKDGMKYFGGDEMEKKDSIRKVGKNIGIGVLIIVMGQLVNWVFAFFQ